MFYYIGDGSHYWPGVPMRDHSKAEWDALPEAVRKALVANKLFSGTKPGVTPEQQAEAPTESPAKPGKGG